LNKKEINKEEEEFLEFKEIDLNYINHPVMFFDNVPATVFLPLGLIIIGLLFRNVVFFSFCIVLSVLSVYIIIFLYKKNETFSSIFKAFGYAYKPIFFFLRPEKWEKNNKK